MDTSSIREHMPVLGSCGSQVGTVDRIEGRNIKLTRDDPNATGQHHWIPLSWVDSVDEGVRLTLTCDEALREWRSSPAKMMV